MNIWHDCPRCGKANSASGDAFCGACEQAYHEAEADYEAMLKEEQDRLARRCWIHGTSEQAEYLGSAGPCRMKIRRTSGIIETVTVEWMEPAEMPGGGLIICLA